MAHYFTREEAEALLPEIIPVLRQIQEARQILRRSEEDLEALRLQAMGNGYHLHERIANHQRELAQNIQTLQGLAGDLDLFGCELKDPDTGLIDFLSLRADRPIYLCWRLGEERINYWHYLETGIAGRQPL